MNKHDKEGGRDDFYVYMYLAPDGCPFYIGKGRGNRHLIDRHLSTSWVGKFLINKIMKVGPNNIKTHFLHKDISEEQAIKWERYWIAYIGRRDLKSGTLCNMTDGGDGKSGWVCRADTRRKMSLAQTGRKHTKETIAKMSQVQSGRTFSRETLLLMSRARIGKLPSVETRKRMSESQKIRWAKLRDGLIGGGN